MYVNCHSKIFIATNFLTSVASWLPTVAIMYGRATELQVLAIEFVLLANDFVPLANEFVNEFVPLAIEFIALA